MNAERNRRLFAVLPFVCASLTIARGLLTFVGWISGLPLLASVRAEYIPMAPSTALCFSLIGLGLLVRQKICPLAQLFALRDGRIAVACVCTEWGGAAELCDASESEVARDDARPMNDGVKGYLWRLREGAGLNRDVAKKFYQILVEHDMADLVTAENSCKEMKTRRDPARPQSK